MSIIVIVTKKWWYNLVNLKRQRNFQNCFINKIDWLFKEKKRKKNWKNDYYHFIEKYIVYCDYNITFLDKDTKFIFFPLCTLKDTEHKQ